MTTLARRVGLLGGTFDPPHIGHLVTALNVRHELSLDVVLLVVANEPWQKVGVREITPAALRLDMVRAAAEGVAGLKPCAIEIERGGRTYTVDTIEELRRRRPEVEPVVILGSDAAARLDTWHRATDLAAAAEFVVVERPGADVDVPAGFRVRRVQVPHLDVSSTDIRGRVASGRPIEFLVPPGVCSLIHDHGLYRVAHVRGLPTSLDD